MNPRTCRLHLSTPRVVGLEGHVLTEPFLARTPRPNESRRAAAPRPLKARQLHRLQYKRQPGKPLGHTPKPSSRHTPDRLFTHRP